MRSFEQRRAEIFRRSEERIKARKKRRCRVLAGCIPLVLCVCLYAAFVQGGNMWDTAGHMQDSDAMENMGIDSNGAFSGKVQVSGGGVSLTYTDQSGVSEILGIIAGITAVPETVLEAEANTVAVPEDAVREEGYVLICTDAQGSVTEYILTGSVLIERTTLTEHVLTEKEQDALRNVLGIPDT